MPSTPLTPRHALLDQARSVLGCVALCILIPLGPSLRAQAPTAPASPAIANKTAFEAGALTLCEGDVLQITFPGSPDLDTTQTIRRDGRISLLLIGEIRAAGLKPADLQNEIVRLYSSQLTTKEINVTVVSSSLPVFVTGAVYRSIKITADRPMTAFQAIIEAGLESQRANLKAVVVIRRDGAKTKRFELNLVKVLEGHEMDLFQLEPGDIVFVPERIF